MRRTVRHLADGREIIYFDESVDTPPRVAVDQRDLPALSPASEIRQDPLTGEWVVFAAHRQTRTYKPPADLCPLCPSSDGRHTEIPESDYDVVVFENRFPSLSQHSQLLPSPVDSGDLYRRESGRGRCEVVCFTSNHNGSFSQLTPSRVRTVMDVWADRTVEMSAMGGIEQVFPFENKGEEIGVTLHHPHGQIYGYPFVTPKTHQMMNTARRHHEQYGTPLFADILAAERKAEIRIVAESEHWTAFVPQAARWPVHVQLVPHRQVPDIPALTDTERNDFATIYLNVLNRCDALYGRQLPYIAAWHQAPVRRDRDIAWLHLELFSILRTKDKIKYLAGSESGMAVWINDVLPEDLAQRLRTIQPAG